MQSHDPLAPSHAHPIMPPFVPLGILTPLALLAQRWWKSQCAGKPSASALALHAISHTSNVCVRMASICRR